MPTFKRVNSSDTQVFNYTDSTESRLVGIQECSFNSQKQFTELSELGKFGTQNRILNSNQTTELKLDFILNEEKTNDPFFAFTDSGFLSTGSLNFKIRDLAGENKISGAYLQNYSLNLEVGEIPEGSISFQADSISYNDTNNLEYNEQTSDSDIAFLNPNNITVSTNFDEGINTTSYCVSSVSIDVSLDRAPVTRIGSKVPKYRYPDPNVNGEISVSILKNQVTGVDLSSLVLEKGNLTIKFNPNETSEKTYQVQNCSLISVSEDASLDDDTKMNFNYSFNLKDNNNIFN
tara:strand:+ start:882 stop:1751 length:870 start_codon:yes stop_codon:yes gene_type:complete